MESIVKSHSPTRPCLTYRTGATRVSFYHLVESILRAHWRQFRSQLYSAPANLTVFPERIHERSFYPSTCMPPPLTCYHLPNTSEPRRGLGWVCGELGSNRRTLRHAVFSHWEGSTPSASTGRHNPTYAASHQTHSRMEDTAHAGTHRYLNPTAAFQEPKRHVSSP